MSDPTITPEDARRLWEAARKALNTPSGMLNVKALDVMTLAAEVERLSGEVERLRAALEDVRVGPHGHPGAPGQPWPPDKCIVCRSIAATLTDEGE